MSLQFANTGTSYNTYAMNWDRNGGWSNYLAQLSLQNNHDRQISNGEFNSVAGLQNITYASPFDTQPIANNITGYPMKASYSQPVNFTVNTKPSKAKKEKVQKMKKAGLNLRYLGANGV